MPRSNTFIGNKTNQRLSGFKDLSKRKGLKLVGLNIRSLLSKQSQIEAEMSANKIDVLSLTETWLNEKTHNGLIRIPEYKVYRYDRKLNKRGGGIAVYVQGRLTVNASVYEELNISDKDIEVLVLSIRQKCTKPITVISVYRPPQGNQKSGIEKLKQIIQAVNRDEDIVVLGDLNIDYSNKRCAKELTALEREFNLKQRINTPTRITRQSKTIIDHIYTNSNKVKGSRILTSNISDHYPIFIILKKAAVVYERVSFKCRQTKHLKIEDLHKQLKMEDWSKFYLESDVNLAWLEMYRIYSAVLDRLCPMVEYINVRRKQLWITSNLFELMKRRDYCFKLAKKTGRKEDWAEAKKQRNITNDACCKAKGEYIKGKLNEDSGNPKKFWGHLKPLVKQEKQEKIHIELDGSSTENTIPDMFNKFFSSVGTNLKSKIEPLSKTEEALLKRNEVVSPDNEKPRFKFRKTNTIEVESVVKKLHNHKASGIPNISSFLFKECLKATLDQTAYLINLSIETERVPSDWKCATITPVHKAGSPRIPDNYRPISILPIMTKLLEKCIHTQLITYLEDNDILSENQFGFRSGHSTSMAITTLLLDIYDNYNANKYIANCVTLT